MTRNHIISVYADYADTMSKMSATIAALKDTIQHIHDRNDKAFLELQIKMLEEDLNELVMKISETVTDIIEGK
jgi:hypothetical protein